MRDDLLVPLAGRGPQGRFSLSATAHSDPVDVSLSSDGGFCWMTDRFSFKGVGIASDIDLSALHQIQNTQSGTVSAGLCGSWMMDNRIVFDWDSEHAYWASLWAIGPALSFSRKLTDKTSLAISGHTPLLAAISRPPLHRFNKVDTLDHIGWEVGAANSNLKATTLDRFQSIAVRADLVWARMNGTLAIGLDGSFTHVRDPKDYTALAIGLHLGRSITAIRRKSP